MNIFQDFNMMCIKYQQDNMFLLLLKRGHKLIFCDLSKDYYVQK